MATTCEYIFARGNRAGKACGRKASLQGCGDILCIHHKHQPVSPAQAPAALNIYINLLRNDTSASDFATCLCMRQATVNGVCATCLTFSDLVECQGCKRVGRSMLVNEHQTAAHSRKRILPYVLASSVSDPIIARAIDERAMVFECECGFVCDRHAVYMRHINEHVDDTNICDFCHNDVADRRIVHMVASHTSSIVRCPLNGCSRTLADGSDATLNLHLSIYHRPCFVCKICDILVYEQHDLNKHMKSHMSALDVHNWCVYAHKHTDRGSAAMSVLWVKNASLPDVVMAAVRAGYLQRLVRHAFECHPYHFQSALAAHITDDHCSANPDTRWLTMPNELWTMVLDYAGTNGRLSMAQTCKKMNALCESRTVDKFAAQFAAMARIPKTVDLDQACLSPSWVTCNVPGTTSDRCKLTDVALKAYKAHGSVDDFRRAFVLFKSS